MTRRYAEDTKVEILETRQEIDALLRKAKGERIVVMDEADGATVGRWFGPGLRFAYERGEMLSHPLMREGLKK